MVATVHIVDDDESLRRAIDSLVRLQLRKTEWNTDACEKDLAHLGGLDG